LGRDPVWQPRCLTESLTGGDRGPRRATRHDYAALRTELPVARLAAVLSGLAAITANPPPTEPIHLGALVDTLPSDAPAVRAAPGLVYPAYLARLIEARS
jgi:hypothetical protein